MRDGLKGLARGRELIHIQLGAGAQNVFFSLVVLGLLAVWRRFLGRPSGLEGKSACSAENEVAAMQCMGNARREGGMSYAGAGGLGGR